MIKKTTTPGFNIKRPEGVSKHL